MVNKYFILIPFIVYLSGYCISADNTTTQNKKESTSKCKEKQNKTNSILDNKEKLRKWNLFLEKLNVNLIKDVNEANKLLNDITNNKYSEKELKIIINKFNDKIKQIEESYNKLFELSDQDNSDNKNKIKLSKKPQLSRVNNNNVQLITTLNWSKDVRKNTNVTNKTHVVKENLNDIPDSDLNNINEENNNHERIVLTPNSPCVSSHEQKIYDCNSVNNRLQEEVPVQGIITNKTHDDEINTKSINKLPN